MSRPHAQLAAKPVEQLDTQAERDLSVCEGLPDVCDPPDQAFRLGRGRLKLIHLLLAVAILGLLLAMVMLLEVRVQGRLGEPLSPEFLVHHFPAIFCGSSGMLDGVAAVAGVDQRLGRWSEIIGS